jgi:hypothetical protein
MEPAAEDVPRAEPDSTRRHWSPRPVETASAAAGAVVAVLLALVADPAGRVLALVAAVGLAALTAADLLLRPRLTAEPAGIRLRTLAVRRRLPWSAVERVDVDERTRYGLTARTLELEAGGALVVLGRRALGEDPRDVADALARIRYTGRKAAD